MKPIFTCLCHAYADKLDIKPDVIPASSIKKFFGFVSKPVPAKTKPIEESAFVETPQFLKFAVLEFYKECQRYLTKAGFPDENFLIELIDEGKLDLKKLQDRVLDNYDERMPAIRSAQKNLSYAQEKLSKFPQNTGLKRAIEDYEKTLAYRQSLFINDLFFDLNELA